MRGARQIHKEKSGREMGEGEGVEERAQGGGRESVGDMYNTE